MSDMALPKTGAFPRFSTEEYARRQRDLRADMEADGLDALLIWREFPIARERARFLCFQLPFPATNQIAANTKAPPGLRKAVSLINYQAHSLALELC